MPRGSKPGERRGGRKPGTPNRVSVELQKAAQAYTPAALKTLSSICSKGQSETARVAAANALLDRGYGKPSSHVTGEIKAETVTKYESVEETAAWIKQVLAEHPNAEKQSKEIK